MLMGMASDTAFTLLEITMQNEADPLAKPNNIAINYTSQQRRSNKIPKTGFQKSHSNSAIIEIDSKVISEMTIRLHLRRASGGRHQRSRADGVLGYSSVRTVREPLGN